MGPNTTLTPGSITRDRSERMRRKTKTGCKTCKRRKIKCDEGRPSCHNCVRHAVECDFARTVSPAAASSLGPETPLNILDLELLHNFTSSTYTTLTSDPASRNVWKGTIVRRAISCEYVMRSILAVSGIHIAQHRPEKRHEYIAHAFQHHRASSRIAMDLMTEVLPQNQENLWIFSVLTVFFALGSPKASSSSTLLLGDHVVPDWIFLLSGVQRILNMLMSGSYVGILSPLWKNGSTRYNAARQPEFQESGLLRELSANIEASVSDPDDLASYKLAINHLIYQLGLALSPGSQNLDIVDAFVWHFVAPESFMLLLKQKRQAAIVIFVHSLIVFHALNSNHWLHGWDILLLSRAWTMLDGEHRLWIQWPIEEIGWAPPPDNIS